MTHPKALVHNHAITDDRPEIGNGIPVPQIRRVEGKDAEEEAQAREEDEKVPGSPDQVGRRRNRARL